jgi:hypothetical protein
MRTPDLETRIAIDLATNSLAELATAAARPQVTP